MKRIQLGLSLVAILSILPLAAHAHRGWMIPGVAEVEGKEAWVTIKAAISEDLFVVDHRPLALDALVVTAPDGTTGKPERVFNGQQFSVADVKLSQNGTYRLSLGNETAMASYKLNGESRRWRGLPPALAAEIPAGAEELQVTTTFARLETWVTANEPSRGALAPLGKGLEILPLDQPTGLLVGQKTRFRVLFDGKPLPGLTIGVVPGGVRYRGVLKEFALVSDAQGEFVVAWPRAEMYWLNTSYPPRAPAPAEGQARPAAAKERHTYSATFEVLPE